MQGERASTIAPFIMPTAYLQMDKRKDIAIRRPPLYDAQDILSPYGGFSYPPRMWEKADDISMD